MAQWIRKDDKVLVIAGNNKGRIGTVISHKKDYVVLQGINIRKKHAKRKGRTATPAIIDIEMPIHISNVQICNEDGEPIALKVREGKAGKRELYYLKGEKEVAYRVLKKGNNKQSTKE
jgi:large subunit ribosomal protein L24